MTMLMTLCALPTSTDTRASTRHTPSVEVTPVPMWRPAQKSEDHARALARSIAATAHRHFFDGRGDLGGEG